MLTTVTLGCVSLKLMIEMKGTYKVPTTNMAATPIFFL